VIVLRTPALEVEILPDVGGKVAQIRHRESGRDLLISPRRPYRPIPSDRPWVEYDTSGMDDCFPNVDEGSYPFEPWRGRRLPQLGEWVRGAWDVVHAETHAVTLERAGSVLPYRATKRVELADDNTLRLTYNVRNTGREGFAYIWSAHPLIAVRETFEVRLPGRELRFATFPDNGEAHRWPAYEGVDLSREWLPRGKTLKAFVSGMDAGWCELVADELLLRFDFDLSANPVVGLWFNNYGFAGGGDRPFRCIAVEPCTSPTDVLHALPATAYPFLAPASHAHWSWSVRVG
jgi:hypothetical protein